MADLADTAREMLDAEWRNMRDGMPRPARMYVAGAIEMARRLGALTDEQAELWAFRIATTCPGHDDEGGRAWCAYCGVMPREEPPCSP